MGQHTITEEQKSIHRNSLTYNGWVRSVEAFRTKNGKVIVKALIAEQHQAKNRNAPKQFRDANKGEDEYVDTTTSWHRITIVGDKAEDLAQDPEFNKNALVLIIGASYGEEAPWVDKQGVNRAGRPETVGDSSTVAIRFAPRDPLPAAWDGFSDLPEQTFGGGGSGSGPKAPEYADDEGF